MTKPKRQAPPFTLEPIAVGLDGACALLDCGRTHTYRLINAGALSAYKEGASTKITMDSIRRHVAARLEEGFRGKGRRPTRRAAA